MTVEFLDPKVTNYGYQSNTGTWDYGPSGLIRRLILMRVSRIRFGWETRQ